MAKLLRKRRCSYLSSCAHQHRSLTADGAPHLQYEVLAACKPLRGGESHFEVRSGDITSTSALRLNEQGCWTALTHNLSSGHVLMRLRAKARHASVRSSGSAYSRREQAFSLQCRLFLAPNSTQQARFLGHHRVSICQRVVECPTQGSGPSPGQN